MLSSNAIALIDLAVFRHVTCAEHGEIIHADDHVMGAAPESEHYDAVSEAPVVAGHGHDHCVVTLLGRDETIDPWLEEIRNPIWHGTPQEQADEAYREQRERASQDRWNGLIGGEPMRDFVDRIHLGTTLFLEERGVRRLPSDFSLWEIDDPDRKVALVAHAGTNSVAICHLLGIPAVPWEWDRFVIGHASISRVKTMQMGDGHTFGLRKLSDVEHLTHDDRTE